jgi:DNA replication protein DnaC
MTWAQRNGTEYMADWIRKGQPLCLIGDSGTGKSHRLIGLGTAAAEKGFRVMYTLASRLVRACRSRER